MTGSTVAAALTEAHRREWAYVLAAAVRVTRDLDLAEECVQDAYASALRRWSVDGVPARPGAWLTTAARNRAVDLIRREDVSRRALPLLVVDEVVQDEPGRPPDLFADDRLALIFTCCHPALSDEAQVALTLRFVCGMSTAEIARSCLVKEATMAARLTRAKQKIASARIPYRIPEAADLAERTARALDVIHLLFANGHAAPSGSALRRPDVSARALDLARMLCELLPGDGEAMGLLALIVLSESRAAERVGSDGRLQRLEDQDRSRWDAGLISEGRALVARSLALPGPPGRYALMAAINAVHAEAQSWEATDWSEIVGLYDLLLTVWPNPVVALNRAVAVRFCAGPEAGLELLDELVADPRLALYPYLPAARAECLVALGRPEEAKPLYEEAAVLTENDVERAFLAERLAALPS